MQKKEEKQQSISLTDLLAKKDFPLLTSENLALDNAAAAATSKKLNELASKQ